MQVLKKFGIASSAVAVAAISIALAAPAGADTGAQPGDVVGVGSDTVQNAADFVFDGAPGVAGAYNSLGNVNRVDNVFSTGDANGRTAYDGTCGAINSATGLGGFCSATNAGAPNVLTPSVSIRAGSKPVLRPNGSGGGIGALIADSAGSSSGNYKGLPNDSIAFARSSRLPKGTGEEDICDQNASGCGGLHVIQFATDDLGIARVSSGFKGPAGLTAQTLLGIYTCQYKKWSDIPGNTSGSSDAIYPVAPPPTSGTSSFFLQDLAKANGGTAVSYGDCVHIAQEHDPTGIYSAPTPGDALEPFSKGKLSLLNNGYYVNGVSYSGTNAANGAFTPGYLQLESGSVTGQPGASDGNYTSTRGLYFVVRQVDYASKKPFQDGSTDNFVQALFTDSNSAIQSGVGQAEITAAGFTPDFADCGVDPTSASACQG